MQLIGPPGALILALAFIIAGTILFAMGFRGRKLNDHPHCRKCRFDLSGVYPAKVQCPECGSVLDQPKRIRTGYRDRNRRLMAVGTAPLLLGVALAVTTAWTSGSNLNWNTILPTRVLVWRAEHLPDQAVLIELRSRRVAGRLDNETIHQLVGYALRVHSDMKTPWLKEWGDFVEEAWLEGSLDKEKWTRYTDELITRVEFEPKSTIRVGDPWTLELATGCRVGAVGRLLQMVEAKCIELESSNGARTPVACASTLCWAGIWSESPEGGGSSSLVDTSGCRVPALVPGQYVLRAQVLQTLTSEINPQFRTEKRLELERMVTILSSDAPLYRTLHDPSLFKRIRDSVRISNVSDEYGSLSSMKRPSGDVIVMGGIQIIRPPVGVAFEIWVRAPGRGEFKCLEALSTTLGQNSEDWGISFNSPAPAPQFIDVILWPSLDVAQRSKDVNEYWGDEVVIANVPVKPWKRLPVTVSLPAPSAPPSAPGSP